MMAVQARVRLACLESLLLLLFALFLSFLVTTSSSLSLLSLPLRSLLLTQVTHFLSLTRSPLQLHIPSKGAPGEGPDSFAPHANSPQPSPELVQRFDNCAANFSI